MNWATVLLVISALPAVGFGAIMAKKYEFGHIARDRRNERKTTGVRENAFMDQLQEQVDKLTTRVDRMERREVLLIQHIFTVKAHFANGGKPPGPEMPDLP